MKTSFLKSAPLAIGAIAIGLTTAAAGPITNPKFTEGRILSVFADPSDFVVLLDTPGPCGSSFFHSQRANTNFKEMVSVLLTGFSTTKTVGFWVTSCENDRNVADHGYVRN